ncbi:MAG: selenide, water dikinase SelD [bacterium]|nr:selenide, water dikinase SelD [Gammaproteobacteria bacterium]HIL95827.1 selenide, water dikinase SelD [Pseudomonadales bacterium]
MELTSPIAKDLVLLGGGHSHVILLKMLAMNPVAGLQITLISPDTRTPYSGMLPGVVAGHYGSEDIYIDLVPLCRFAGARFIKTRVTNIDPYSKFVECDGRPPINYDVLSINVGITPSLASIENIAEKVIAVKPISEFLPRWSAFLARAKKSKVQNVGIVGAGAGGVELCLAINHRLRQEINSTAIVHLLTDDQHILANYPAQVQARFNKQLEKHQVHLHTGFEVVDIQDGIHGRELVAANENRLALDKVFWVTAAASQGWLADTSLPLDDQGFVSVRDTLQVVEFDDIFAAGDIAHVLPHPRPKAGVFAVRQGPVLYNNIRRYLLGKPPRPYVPQGQFLSLISTGNKNAVASRNGFTLEGRFIWLWKNWIDQRFMRRFTELPVMEAAHNTGLLADFDNQMHCGGCGSKVSADLLHEVLQEINITADNLDDAAVFEVPAGKLMLHTIDSFKSFIDDPYVFAQIAVNHALGDIYAMGGEPVTALATITVPYAKPGITRSILQQLLQGAKEMLDKEGVELVGGHTSEGSELSMGFAVNGLASRAELLTKGGMEEGEVLILTKALGTGILFAADMQYQATGAWIDLALASMLQSNRFAMKVFKKSGATSCTDITGFGLAGHLREMLTASGKSGILDLNSIPVMEGAESVFSQGIRSSLHEGNERSCIGIQKADHPLYPLLFDPQTSGGLLASVKQDQVSHVLDELHANGYAQACVIGEVAGQAKGAITFTAALRSWKPDNAQ